MENTIFIHTLQQAKNGDTSAQEQIICKFQPMIRKYAYKCHAMEYEDAQQELTLALLIAIQSIKYIQNEGPLKVKPLLHFLHTVTSVL